MTTITSKYLSSRSSAAYADIAAQLRAERERRGLTQGALGRTLGCAGSQVSTWETCYTVPGVTTLAAWADALGFQLTLTPIDEAAGNPS